MRKGLLSAVLLFALLILGVSACAKSTPTPSASPSPTATAKSTPASSPSTTPPIVLKWAAQTPPPPHTMGATTDWLGKEFEKRSQGRVKIEWYWNATLAPAAETMNALRTGVADVSLVSSAYQPGLVPLTTVAGLPGIVTDMWAGITAMNELEKMPEFQAENDGNNVVYFAGIGSSSHSIISNKSIRSLADLKGKKIATSGQILVLLKELGAAPLTMVSTEIYGAMEKGTVDGASCNPAYGGSYKFQEVAPYWYSIPLGANLYNYFINKATWNKLPADVRGLMADLQAENAKMFYKMYQEEGDGKAWVDIKAKMKEVNEPSPQDLAQMTKVAQDTVWKKWVDDTNKKGLAGQKVLDNWLELNKKYHAQKHPF